MKSAIWRHAVLPIRATASCICLAFVTHCRAATFGILEPCALARPRNILPEMGVQHHILAIVQTDLPLICTLRRTLEAYGFGGFSVARNSQEAILYLRGVGIYQDRFRYPIPTVIILDSENPDSIDLDVLAWLRQNPAFADLPVIILCAEKHAPTHFSCMLDSGSFLVDRDNLSELPDALRTLDQTIFGQMREKLYFNFQSALISARGESHPRP